MDQEQNNINAQEKLKHITEIYNTEYINEQGLHVITDLGLNLSGALIDIKNGIADGIVISTLEDIEKRLGQIAKILEVR